MFCPASFWIVGLSNIHFIVLDIGDFVYVSHMEIVNLGTVLPAIPDGTVGSLTKRIRAFALFNFYR